jgi:anthranilate synthase component II
MRLRVLILDNYDSFTYNLVQLVEESNAIPVVIKNDQLSLDEVGGYDKILFSPGAGIPSEIPIMKRILEHYGRTKSILGICLGHQAIAEAYGAKLFNMPEVLHGKKFRIEITDRNDYLFKNLPESFEVGLYHSWAVDKHYLPKTIKITATSSNGIIMALSHLTDDVKGIQFHPESYMTEYGKGIINNWLYH